MQNHSHYKRLLEQQKAKGLLRELNPIKILPEAKVTKDQEHLINFVSNNYLDLSHHPQIIKAMEVALTEYGAGSTGSRLLGGDLEIFHQTEDYLAKHKGFEAARLYATGYMANVGFISAVCQRKHIFCDRLVHASVIDGARLAGAKIHRFKHNDVEDLERLLQKYPDEGWIAVESLYSMDGDFAPLAKIVQLAKKHGQKIVVDEAHAEGVWGPQGKGLVHEWGLEKQVDAVIATYGKAYGVAGACVLSSQELAQWLQNQSRAFIYSTAMSPAIAAGIVASLQVAERESWRQVQVQERSTELRESLQNMGINTLNSQSQIIPLVMGSNEKALKAAQYLQKEGIWAAAIREPTVPRGTARLRINITAGHSHLHIDKLICALRNFFKKEL